jgi:CspA family cold shock protein
MRVVAPQRLERHEKIFVSASGAAAFTAGGSRACRRETPLPQGLGLAMAVFFRFLRALSDFGCSRLHCGCLWGRAGQKETPKTRFVARSAAMHIHVVFDLDKLRRPTVQKGTVKWFNPTKGYGFIRPSTGDKDVFVHISAVERAGLSSLNEGQVLEYELVTNRGKSSAENLKVA